MNQFTQWNRLYRLLIFFNDILGRKTICKVLISGLMIPVLELGGLALIFPFLKLATDTEFHTLLIKHVNTNTYLISLQPYFENHIWAVSFVGIGIVFIYVIRSWLTAYLLNYQSIISAYINANTSEKLINDALNSRYQLFIEHSPTEITGVSFSHTAHAAILFQSLITAFIEILLLSIILIGLIFTSPFVFLFLLLIVFILSVGFFRPLSRRIAVTGRQARELDLKRSRYVHAMANSIRDIKIMGLEDVFNQRNRKLAMENAQLVSRYSFIATIQRLMVELILGCSIVVAAIWFAWSGSNLNQSAPTIVTLGLIAIRCAPSLSRLAGAYTGFRYYFPFVEGLLEIRNILANYPQKRELQTADFPGEYKAQGLYFSYGMNLVLHDCSITIGKGEVVAVVGASGSGKSTLLDLLAGLQPPSKGNFTLGGKEFSPFLSSTFPHQIGYVPQTITLLDETLVFNIALEENPDLLRLEKAINRASLASFVQSLPKGLDTLLGDGGQGLSGGQRQRLGIARALYRQPALLILDEITSALDESTAHEVMNELLGMRSTVSLLFVTHDLRWVQADRIYQLDHGSLSLRTI